MPQVDNKGMISWQPHKDALYTANTAALTAGQLTATRVDASTLSAEFTSATPTQPITRKQIIAAATDNFFFDPEEGPLTHDDVVEFIRELGFTVED